MAVYQFQEWQGIQFVDPVIRDYDITVLPDSSTTMKVLVSLRFESLPQTVGNPEVKLLVPVLNLNGDEGNMDQRIWSYLNDPINGFIVI